MADTPIARRTDPVTSHQAAEHITANGTRGAQQAAVYTWVKSYPGHTAQELAELCLSKGGTLDRYVFGRRLSEIAATEDPRTHKPLSPLVFAGKEKRKCKITGRLALVWWPVDYRLQLL